MSDQAPHPPISVRMARLSHGVGLPLPTRATPGSAGADLFAAVNDPLVIAPGDRALIPTGLIMEIPPGMEGQLRPRSGLALKHGITLLNAPGTVDSDYRGEVKVILINLGHLPFTVTRGMRVAQLVISPVTAVCMVEVQSAADLDSSLRDTGGFGSSGPGLHLATRP